MSEITGSLRDARCKLTLKEWRHVKGLSMRQLAYRCGIQTGRTVTSETISDIESGMYSAVSVGLERAIPRALELTPEDEIIWPKVWTP